MRLFVRLVGGLLAVALLLGPARAEPIPETDDLLRRVQARVESAAVLRGAFAQRKTLQGFKNPLVSSGRFLVARDAGVIWDTQQPFASMLVVGANSIRIDGMEQIGGEQPAVARINQLLVAAMAGELATLRSGFAIEAALDDASWTLRLTPRDGAMVQVITAIELAGDRHVEHIRIFDGDGNRTDIELSGHNAQPPALTDEEAARFD